MDSYIAYEDTELLKLLKSGSEAAFTELYNRYWEKLLAMAFRLTSDQFSAKEIVQELFIGIWKRREQIEVKHLESYLATAVKFSFFRETERARRRHQIETKELSKSQEADLEEEVESLFLKEFIRGKVEQLPKKCRIVYNYSRVHHKSNAEIANELNISEKTVEAHLTKSIRFLKQSLEENGFTIIIGITICELIV